MVDSCESSQRSLRAPREILHVLSSDYEASEHGCSVGMLKTAAMRDRDVSDTLTSRFEPAQNVMRAPSWITRFELGRTPLIEPKAGFVCTPVAKSKVAVVFTP